MSNAYEQIRILLKSLSADECIRLAGMFEEHALYLVKEARQERNRPKRYPNITMINCNTK